MRASVRLRSLIHQWGEFTGRTRVKPGPRSLPLCLPVLLFSSIICEIPPYASKQTRGDAAQTSVDASLASLPPRLSPTHGRLD